MGPEPRPAILAQREDVNRAQTSSSRRPGPSALAWALVAALAFVVGLIQPASLYAQPAAAVSPADLPEGVAAREGEVIDEIRVRGNRRVEAESILQQVRTAAGRPIDLRTISQDIERVFKLGYFEDIRVDATRTEEGRVIVTFIVNEKPSITAIRYVGNEALDQEEIEEVVNLRKFAILDVSQVKQNAEKIRELYAEKGYYLAEVDYEIEIDPQAPEQAVVVFEIREFQKVEVKRVTLLGNRNIPDEELKAVMLTRPGDFLSFITDFGNFKEQAFEQDLQRLTAYYYDKGYVQVEISQPTVRLSRDKRYLYITVRIKEGPRFKVGSVELQGDFIAPRGRLDELTELKGDDFFSYGTMRRDVERLRDFYQDAGYAYVNVNPLTQVDAENQSVDVVYDLQKGNKVYFGRIDIVGNVKTRDKVIRRELTIEEGDLYSNEDIERSRRNVLRLGFFEKVEISTQRGERDDVINARVEVVERPTGTFQLGAGFSSAENIIANAQISQNNLFGRGQTLAFQLQYSSLRTLFNLTFREPYLFDSNWQLSFDLYNFGYVLPNYERTSTGGRVEVGYPFQIFGDYNDDLVLSLTYKLENVSLEPRGVSGRAAAAAQSTLFQGGLTSSVLFSGRLDLRNDRLFPTDGSYHSASVEVADDVWTVSENEFIKYDVNTRWYVPLFWQFVLRFQAQAGFVFNIDPNKPVPLFERYFIGGPNTVRGFRRFSLGPAREVARNSADPGTDLTAFRIGGNKRLVFTSEIEFPILTAINLKGVLFFDAGNAFDDDQPLTLALDVFSDADDLYDDTLRTAVGLGFRWFSPIGPLRFEWGIPLARLRDEQPLVFEFSIGPAF